MGCSRFCLTVKFGLVLWTQFVSYISPYSFHRSLRKGFQAHPLSKDICRGNNASLRYSKKMMAHHFYCSGSCAQEFYCVPVTESRPFASRQYAVFNNASKQDSTLFAVYCVSHQLICVPGTELVSWYREKNDMNQYHPSVSCILHTGWLCSTRVTSSAKSQWKHKQ